MSEIDHNLVKSAIEEQGKAFKEFKATNDQRLADLEKKGSTDPLVEDKLKKIEKSLDSLEDVNQKRFRFLMSIPIVIVNKPFYMEHMLIS